MQTQISKFQLTTALFTGGQLTLNGVVIFKIVNAVEREDGSNHSYNVTGINYNGLKATLHLRTMD